MLYTIIPEEVVLEGIDEEYPATKEVFYQGILMQVIPVPDGEGEAVVERLISSDPAVFLRSDLKPGSIIRMEHSPDTSGY